MSSAAARGAYQPAIPEEFSVVHGNGDLDRPGWCLQVSGGSLMVTVYLKCGLLAVLRQRLLWVLFSTVPKPWYCGRPPICLSWGLWFCSAGERLCLFVDYNVMMYLILLVHSWITDKDFLDIAWSDWLLSDWLEE